MSTSINDCKIQQLPKIKDHRGNISVIEKEVLNYSIKRVYYLYDVPSGAKRGGHAHIDQHELLIAVSGSFDVIVNDGNAKKTVSLNKPDQGFLIPKGIWRELENFSSGSVCLVLASDVYIESDYIREFETYKSFKSNNSSF